MAPVSLCRDGQRAPQRLQPRRSEQCPCSQNSLWRAHCLRGCIQYCEACDCASPLSPLAFGRERRARGRGDGTCSIVPPSSSCTCCPFSWFPHLFPSLPSPRSTRWFPPQTSRSDTGPGEAAEEGMKQNDPRYHLSQVAFAGVWHNGFSPVTLDVSPL